MMMRNHWKPALAAALSLVVLGLTGCGGGSSGSTGSHLAVRAFVSDNFDGTLHIENALLDTQSFFTISTGNQPGPMALSPDKTLTLVFNAGSNTLAVVTNATETVAGTIVLPLNSSPSPNPPGGSASYVVLNDAVGFAAVHNLNAVEVLSLVSPFNITQSVTVQQQAQQPAAPPVPLNSPTTLVLSPDGKKLLVFAAAGDQVDSLTVIDTTAAQSSNPPPAAAAVQITDPSFSRPVYGVFSADGTKAFILNCGPECGGTTASVSVLDMTHSPPVVTGAPISVPAATVGLLVGSSLFVAGTPRGTLGLNNGKLTVVDTNAMTAGAPIDIGDGYHHRMEVATNSKIFIGALTCTNDPNTPHSGCLTIFDTANASAVVEDAPSSQVAGTLGVTGIAPIDARNVVYVVERGELHIYDTTTSALTPQQIDIIGAAVDVKYVDK